MKSTLIKFLRFCLQLLIVLSPLFIGLYGIKSDDVKMMILSFVVIIIIMIMMWQPWLWTKKQVKASLRLALFIIIILIFAISCLMLIPAFMIGSVGNQITNLIVILLLWVLIDRIIITKINSDKAENNK